MRCAACEEWIDLEDTRPAVKPGQWQGKWYCFDCYNELAHGQVNTIHMHTAKLYPSGAGCPLEPNNDAGPWQENAIRDMEE
jgi:hypothetical protein